MAPKHIVYLDTWSLILWDAELDAGTFMMGCQNYGPFLGTLKNRCRTIMGTPKQHHNFDNHPYTVTVIWTLGSSPCRKPRGWS